MNTAACVSHIKKIAEERSMMLTAIRTCLDLSDRLSADKQIPEAFAATLRDALPQDE